MSEHPVTSWHVPTVLLRAYADGGARDADAWSVEAHLAQCARCTDELARAVVGTRAGAVVASVRPRLLADLPAQVRGPRPTAARRAWLLATSGTGARWAWLLAVAVTVVMAAVLDVVTSTGHQATGTAGAWPATGGWLLVVAPLLPLLGVALSYGAVDPMHELALSTASGGLRLVLWRTLAVVVVSTPAVEVAGLVLGLTAPAAWLLPSLALTVLTLAIGSVVDLARAALGVGVVWLAAVAGPAVAGAAPALLQARFAPLWLALVVIGGASVVARRDAFARRPSSLVKEIS